MAEQTVPDKETQQTGASIPQESAPNAQASKPTARSSAPAHMASRPVAAPTPQASTPAVQTGTPNMPAHSSAAQVGAPTQQARSVVQQAGATVPQAGVSTQQVRAAAPQTSAAAQQVGAQFQQAGTQAQQVGVSTQQVRTAAPQTATTVSQVGAQAQQAGVPVQQVGAPTQQMGAPTQQARAAVPQTTASSAQAGAAAQQTNVAAAQQTVPAAGGITMQSAGIYTPPQRKRGMRIPTLIWLLLLVFAAAGGWYYGHEMMKEKLDYGSLAGSLTITEDQLDETVGTYTLDGETFAITAREAIAQESSLEARRNADGTYTMPTAEDVIAAARTAVVQREVERRGITVSEEEMLAYARDSFGTDDLDSLATAYTMDVETVKARMSESAAMAKLRAEVVTVSASEPAMPAEPDPETAGTPKVEYAEYIIGLAGDEWDADAGVWASQDGPFATALHDYDVSKDGAVYDAALEAYNLAYQQYSESVIVANTQWTEFVNGLLCQARIAVSSLVS